MGFSKMIELLQEKEKGKIILVNAGRFSIKDESLEEFKLITKLYFNEKLEKEYKID